MSHENVSRTEPPKTGSNRTFGYVFTVFFVLVAVVPMLRGHPVRVWSLGVSALVLLAALVRPVLLAPFNRAWMMLGRLLHRITSPIVLGLMYYVIIVPAGLILRVVGKDPLKLRLDPKAASYWIPRDPPGPPAESLTRQF